MQDTIIYVLNLTNNSTSIYWAKVIEMMVLEKLLENTLLSDKNIMHLSL